MSIVVHAACDARGACLDEDDFSERLEGGLLDDEGCGGGIDKVPKLPGCPEGPEGPDDPGGGGGGGNVVGC